MSESQTEELSLRDMLIKAGITHDEDRSKSQSLPAAVSLVVAGKSKSKRIEELIREEVEKALADGQAA
ncbi:MAG: hypothetical protein U5L00_18375 [Desulfovermiculus sp.]|nr:hypothetical protein [Desulfovermiculus sp.]